MSTSEIDCSSQCWQSISPASLGSRPIADLPLGDGPVKGNQATAAGVEAGSNFPCHLLLKAQRNRRGARSDPGLLVDPISGFSGARFTSCPRSCRRHPAPASADSHAMLPLSPRVWVCHGDSPLLCGLTSAGVQVSSLYPRRFVVPKTVISRIFAFCSFLIPSSG